MSALGEGRPQVIDGWTVYVDDSGPTLASDRAQRQRVARWCALSAAVLWVVIPFAAAGSGTRTLAFFLFVAAALLTVGCFRFGRTAPRWTAVPGAVVRRDNPGGKVTFTGKALELTETLDTNQDTGNTKVYSALSATDGGTGIPLLQTDGDSEPLAEVGRWLARHAEIPFRDRRDPARQ